MAAVDCGSTAKALPELWKLNRSSLDDDCVELTALAAAMNLSVLYQLFVELGFAATFPAPFDFDFHSSSRRFEIATAPVATRSQNTTTTIIEAQSVFTDCSIQ